VPQTATPTFLSETASLRSTPDAVFNVGTPRHLESPPLPEDQARADCYALAARLLLAAPDVALLQALADAHREESPEHLPFEGAPASTSPDRAWRRLTAAASVMPVEAVREEFAALFEGIGKPLIDPYGSPYVAGFMMEKPLAALRSDLAAFGIGRSAHASVPEDHLGALCETMRLLIAGAAGLPPRPPADQLDFFSRHLEPWADRCLADIEKAEPATSGEIIATADGAGRCRPIRTAAGGRGAVAGSCRSAWRPRRRIAGAATQREAWLCAGQRGREAAAAAAVAG
jgi:TorA maturation chaperone TorD